MRGARALFVALTVAVSLLVTGTVMALTLTAGGDESDTHKGPRAMGDPGDPAHWTPERMSQARPRDPRAEDGPQPSTSPGPTARPSMEPLPDAVAEAKPNPVRAQAVARPYDRDAVVGKLFFEAPDGPAVCSGTVVTDPSSPGRSNLVWTAGHCVHAGRDGTWFRDFQFVPAFNSSGQATLANLADPGPVAPFGRWRATSITTSEHWRAGGTGSASPATAFDYGIVEVENPDHSSLTLEEVIGGAIPVWFDAPRELEKVTAFGYPQDAPFDGLAMYHCDQDPRRLTVDPASPPLLRIGCTMTAGASGGGWYAKGPDGRILLVSNSALSGADRSWVAGPYLGRDAKKTLEDFTRGR